MKIFIASDHAGYELKKILIEDMTFAGHTVIDCGPDELDLDDDFPLTVSKAVRAVSEAEGARLTNELEYTDGDVRGIVLCGSGVGVSVLANKFPHIRACLFYGGNQEVLTLSREHNDSNVLAIGARLVSENDAIMATRLWLGTSFLSEDRHVRRIRQIEDIEGELNTNLY